MTPASDWLHTGAHRQWFDGAKTLEDSQDPDSIPLKFRSRFSTLSPPRNGDLGVIMVVVDLYLEVLLL